MKENVKEIIADLDGTALKILELIKIKPKNSGELAESLDTSTKTIKRHYATLRKHGLIKSTPGQGISLTTRGVNFYRQYLRDKGTKNVPSKGEKGTENVPLSPRSSVKNEKIDECFAQFPPESLLKRALIESGGEAGRLLLESRLNELGFTLEVEDAPEKLAQLERDGKILQYKDTIALGAVWREVAS